MAMEIKLQKKKIWQSRGFNMSLGIAISLVFLALAFYNVDFVKLLDTFSRIQPKWLLAGAGLILLAYWFRSLLWQQILAGQSKPIRIWTLFRLVTLGYFANNLLPLRLGELVRAWLLGKRENLPTTLALASVVIERGVDLFAMMIYFFIMFFLMSFDKWLRWSGLALAGIGVSFLVALILNHHFGGHLVEYLEKPLSRLPGKLGGWLHHQLDQFLDGLKLLKSFRQIGLAILFSLLTWFTWINVIFICFKALGMELPFAAAIFLMVVLNFGLMLPSSPGGLGVFEFMVILALQPYGISKEMALGMGFTYHMLQYMLTFVIGWIFALQMNISVTEAYRQSKT